MNPGVVVVRLTLVHWYIEFAKLKAMVGAVEEVGVVSDPELLADADDPCDHIVDRHQGAPAVLEDPRHNDCFLRAHHVFRSNVAYQPTRAHGTPTAVQL